jgi:DNA polymerase I-like protein with 3'-5' exonuclease and polymerase domains
MAVNYLVFDVETTIRNHIGNNKGSPFNPLNEVVLWAYCSKGDPWSARGISPHGMFDDIGRPGVLVGHNIKFDMLWCYRYNVKMCKAKIWDTQLAEYILTGQQHTFASLDELSEKYGGTKKDSKIKAYWEAGVDTDKIPADELKEYAEADVKNTEIVFLAQIKEANERGLMPLIKTQMAALAASIEMEHNGVVVDVDYINSQIKNYEKVIETVVAGFVAETGTSDPELIASNKKLGTYLFGGVEKYQEKELVGEYKNGKPKYKLVDKERVIRGVLEPADFGAKKNKLGWVVDDDLIQKLVEDPLLPVSHLGALISEYRTLTKIKSTYYENLRDLVYIDKVHPNISHVTTKTGRLACTQPNLQNQTDAGGIKKAFKSRWEDGYLVELDFNQLEVVALAAISGDEQLIYDINNEVDLHTVLYEEMYGRSPSKVERKKFKPRTFQLIYGASATAIAAQGKIPVEEAKKFIEVFYNRYKGVKKWHDEMIKNAQKYGVPIDEYDKEKGRQRRQYTYQLPTGRTYHFKDYYVEWKRDMAFSPTELKNWPIQGYATGDIVPMMLGVLHNHFKIYDSISKLILTVHDSILFDCRSEKNASLVGQVAKDVLESAPSYLKEMFGIDFPCKLKVGVSIGKTWGDMKEIV